MRNLYFHLVDEGHTSTEYFALLANWTGEIPQKGDFLTMRFDGDEDERVYIVKYRVIYCHKPDDIVIAVEIPK